jgi:hypothetical protein
MGVKVMRGVVVFAGFLAFAFAGVVIGMATANPLIGIGVFSFGLGISFLVAALGITVEQH